MFKKIEVLENNYRAFIKPTPTDITGILAIKQDLSLRLKKLSQKILQLKSNAPASSPLLKSCLNEYLYQIASWHKDSLLWVNIYLDLMWPKDSTLNQAKKTKKLQTKIRQEAKTAWEQIKANPHLSFPSKPKDITQKILLLNKALRTSDPATTEWRFKLNELRLLVYDTMSAQLSYTRHKMKNRFAILVFSVLARTSENPQDESLLTSEIEQERIADFVSGYTPHLKSRYWETIQAQLPLLTAQLKSAQNRMRQQTMMRAAGILMITIAVAWGLRSIDWDSKFFRSFAFEFSKLMNTDHYSLVLKQKKDFFKQQIEQIDRSHLERKIRGNLETFNSQQLYADEAGYYFFAQNILRNFFLLLSNWNTDEKLKEDVLSSAALLNPEIEETLRRITNIYQQQIIQELSLRRELLQLRRIFVRNGTFPFMFIALYNDIPYLFLFPEKIITTYVVSDNLIGKLGIDTEKYKNEKLFPVSGYLVDGSHYPFEDKAGYFEGEFAVVFKKYSPNVNWTAYHETGHVIDYLRYWNEKRKLPDNIELNASLFPLFAKKINQGYANGPLIQRALMRDKDDFYAQAARGILNGYILHFQEKGLLKGTQLISSQFEPDRIDAVRQELEKAQAMDIREAALKMYNQPETYLTTAEKGKYVISLSDAQEVIFGAPHGITKRGFLLGGDMFPGIRNGPRFILQNINERDDGFDAPFSLVAFLRNVFGVIFTRGKNLPQSTQAEALTAAILVFIGFNGFFFFLHFLSTPLRKKKFYGKSPESIIDAAYQNNPWSNGLSFGLEINEKQLLKQLLAYVDTPPKITLEHVAAFKQLADEKKRLFFDICLCLAPFEPQISSIKNKCHDLLFFLPFLGPYIGRSQWLWPVQHHFHQREQYNRDIENLLRSINAQSNPEAILNHFKNIINKFSRADTPFEKQTRLDRSPLASLEQEIQESLMSEDAAHHHINIKFIPDQMMQFNEESQEFDRLDEYYPGDDIRRIDWKATARSTLRKPKIKKYSHPYGFKFALWLDMRFLHTNPGRKKWLRDFTRAMRLCSLTGEENVIEKLFIIRRDGRIHAHVINQRTAKDAAKNAQRVFKKIKEKDQELSLNDRQLNIRGLTFYSDDENQKFMRLVSLTDFGQSIQRIQWKPLPEKNMNIFIIGDMMNISRDIDAVFGKQNKEFTSLPPSSGDRTEGNDSEP